MKTAVVRNAPQRDIHEIINSEVPTLRFQRHLMFHPRLFHFHPLLDYLRLHNRIIPLALRLRAGASIQQLLPYHSTLFSMCYAASSN